MQTQIRIVGGLLRGRKITCDVEPDLRPMPDRVRQALFNILYPAVEGRPFFDIFAGTGAVGMEALSRGASSATFVEFHGRIAANIIRHLETFKVVEQATVRVADAYRWAERWDAANQPAILFLGPPFPHFAQRGEALMALVATLQKKLTPGSILVVQTETTFDVGALPEPSGWDHRPYGRNRVSIWRQGEAPDGLAPPSGDEHS
jgi:16S rRNA (guanine966-N2)-methyltransferase